MNSPYNERLKAWESVKPLRDVIDQSKIARGHLLKSHETARDNGFMIGTREYFECYFKTLYSLQSAPSGTSGNGY